MPRMQCSSSPTRQTGHFAPPPVPAQCGTGIKELARRMNVTSLPSLLCLSWSICSRQARHNEGFGEQRIRAIRKLLSTQTEVCHILGQQTAFIYLAGVVYSICKPAGVLRNPCDE